MLSEHGLKFLSHPRFRCPFSRYQDMLYALRHLTDGIASYRLIGICNLKSNNLPKLLKRTKKIGHIEYGKRENCRITDGGIKYNVLWFAIQDRFNIRDRVPSTFKIYDVPPSKEAIKMLMAEISNEYSHRKSCHKVSFDGRHGRIRDSITKYLDGFRYLKKHEDGVKKIDMIKKTGFGRYYDEFERVALSRGHIEFNEEKKSKLRNPYIKATAEGLDLLNAVNWLATKCDLGDYVPSVVGGFA